MVIEDEWFAEVMRKIDKIIAAEAHAVPEPDQEEERRESDQDKLDRGIHAQRDFEEDKSVHTLEQEGPREKYTKQKSPPE